jgi:hypothetical protein
MIVALAGGIWIFLAVVLVKAPGAAGVGTATGKDSTVDVRLWGRGTDHSRHVPGQRAS